jgi:hypothetical protein
VVVVAWVVVDGVVCCVVVCWAVVVEAGLSVIEGWFTTEEVAAASWVVVCVTTVWSRTVVAEITRPESLVVLEF